MPGLVPGIHVLVATKKDVDGRNGVFSPAMTLQSISRSG